MARRDNMVPLGASYHPRELMELMEKARKPGESKTEFLRRAIVGLAKKRGYKAKLPDVQMGRPRGEEKVDINHNDWTLFDEQGYEKKRGISVARLDDDTVRIGRTVHRREDLSIQSDGLLIQSKIAGWYLSR